MQPTGDATLSAKRPRLAPYQTPGLPLPMSTPMQMPLGTPGFSLAGGDPRFGSTLLDSAARPEPGSVLDYLRGRGGKIKELEDEVALYRSKCDKLQAEVMGLQDANSKLSSENQVLRLTAVSSTGPAAAAEQLNQLLDQELQRALQLERELAGAHQKEAVESQRAASLETMLSEHKAEHSRKLAAAEAEATAVSMRLEQLKAQAASEVADAQLAAKLEKRKREAQEEIQKVVQQQLREAQQLAATLQAQLERAQRRATASEAAAADALSSSAAHVRLRLLEEELRQARDALAAAAPVAAAAAAAGNSVAAPAAAAVGMAPSGGDGGHDIDPIAAAAAEGEAAGSASSGSAPAPDPGFRDALALLMQAASKHMPGLLPGAPPLEVAQAVDDLLAGVGRLRAMVASKDEAIARLDTMAHSADAYAQALQAQLAETRSRMEQALTSERMLQSRVDAITQERDSLRRALTAPASVGAPAASLSGRLTAGQQAAALVELQALNAQLQAQVAELQARVAASSSRADAQCLAAQAAGARADAAEHKVKQLEKEANALAGEVASLQERLGRGELGRGAGVRVLHLRHNPEAEAQRSRKEAELARLAAENDALRTHVSEMEQQLAAAAAAAAVSAGGPGGPGSQHQQGGPASPSGAPRAAAAEGVAASRPGIGGGVAAAVKDAEILLLRRQVHDADKAMARLKAVFKERITVFREACYSLFGYRVDMTAEATAAAEAADAPTTFTLKPQHADDPGAVLVFRSSSGGTHMELVPNAFTSGRCAREADTFIRKFSSIPAFTANLTMDNFQKQTQC